MSHPDPAPASAQGAPAKRPTPAWQKILPWAITLACFSYLYFQIERQASFQGKTAIELLSEVFTRVSWGQWLALMIPYSAFFFLVDSTVVWKVINWFNAKVAWSDILPIRGSAYILSILNEQIGKGVMAVYLNRRDGVPGWQVGSSMLFIMFCEFFYLLSWATLGSWLQWNSIDPLFHRIPWIAFGAFIVFIIWVLYFRGTILPENRFRDRQIMHAFRQAKVRHYLTIVLIRSPALIAAFFVYQRSLSLFGVDVSVADMVGYLPIIFFGAAIPGPFRAVAVAMWPILYPDYAAEMTAFGLVQHNFFIFFNAAIGLLFLRRANRELLG